MSNLEKIEKDKSEFMKALEDLEPTLFDDQVLEKVRVTERTREIMKKSTSSSSVKLSMLTSIPMICKGRSCPQSQVCPLFAENVHPEKQPCPIEMAMVKQFFEAYVDELGVDISRLVEVSMIRALVDQEIQYVRKSKSLSLDHFIQENVIGVDPKSGEPIMRSELHLAVEMEDRIHRRMEKIRSQLLATRESRAKVGQSQLDTAQTIANLLDQQQEIQKQRETLLMQKLGIKQVDTYIQDAEVVKDNDSDG